MDLLTAAFSCRALPVIGLPFRVRVPAAILPEGAEASKWGDILGMTYFPSENWQVVGGYRFEQWAGRDGGDNRIIELGLVRRF